MQNPTLTFSNPSNAVRGFRQLYPQLAQGLSGDVIKGSYLDRNSINLDLVAMAQADRKGDVAGSTLVGVPRPAANRWHLGGCTGSRTVRKAPHWHRSQRCNRGSG